MQNQATADKGRKDAEAAVQLARELGQPADTPIYFGDRFRSVSRQDCALPAARIWPSIEAVFQSGQRGVRAHALAGRRLWRGRHMQAPEGERQGEISSGSRHRSATPARRSSSTAAHWHLFQNVTEIKRSLRARHVRHRRCQSGGSPISAHGRRADRRRRTIPMAARTILDSRAFVKKGCVIQTAPNPKGAQRRSARTFSTTCRIMTAEERGYFGVSLTEDDESTATCTSPISSPADWLAICRSGRPPAVARRRCKRWRGRQTVSVEALAARASGMCLPGRIASPRVSGR